MDDPDDGGRGGPLVALALLVLLVVGCLWLGYRLSETGRLQDCVMSGRTNCAPIRR